MQKENSVVTYHKKYVTHLLKLKMTFIHLSQQYIH